MKSITPRGAQRRMLNMKNVTYGRILVCMLAPFGLLTVACGGGDDEITAENITLEQCEEIFGEGSDDAAADAGDAAGGAGSLPGDYDEDGDEDEDDDAIEERCVELMAEGEE
jgi:hypothetical protein